MTGDEQTDAWGATLAQPASTFGTSRTLASDEPRPADLGEQAATLERGELIDRYVVLTRLGQGGMGVVYAAYDPELDRKVALKLLLKHDRVAGASLLREAQALARLSHANVVAVHDVGTVGERVWLAMDFIEGQTLAQWLAGGRRGWRAVLAAFLAAGEGLAAAHAAGLVHRDFKPDNVMVGADGRVLVTDFGLAQAQQDERSDMSSGTVTVGGGPPSQATVAQDGALFGTPRYMAPEQWRVAATDARTDQFSFCVALWEALYEEAPFKGETLTELALAVTHGELRGSTRRTEAPGRLRRALLRGLAVDPAQRWPSMPALLAELRRDPGRRRRWLLAAGLVLLGVAAATGGRQLARARTIAACEASAGEIAQVWSDEARAAVEAGMLATGVPYAASSFAKAVPWLDAHARAWSEARRDGCVRAELDRTLDRVTYGRMIACLDERRDEVADLVEILQGADRQTILIAVQSVAQLPSPATCSDERRLAQQATDAEADDAEAAAVRRILTHVSALELAGRYEAAAAEAAEAEARAEALGQPLLVARARLRAGNVAVRRGDFAGAASKLEQAFYAAGELGADDVAAEAAWSLVTVVGYRLTRHEAGLAWARLSEMALRRAGAGEDDLRFAIVGNAVGPVHGIRGEYEAALSRFERAAAIWEEQFGPEHPRVGVLHNNMGVIHKSRGDLAASLTHQRRALEILTAAYGPEHPEIATLLGNLGNLEVALGRPQEGLALYQRALTIHEQALGGDHPDVARTLTGLASVERGLGADDAALSHFQRALSILERSLGAEHLDVATALYDLAELQEGRGAHDEAWASLQRSLAIREKHLGGENPGLVPVLVSLGKLAQARGEPAAGVALLERALALVVRHGASAAERAEVEFVLAQALWEAGRERERGLALARKARDDYAADGGHAASKLRAMDDWLAARP